MICKMRLFDIECHYNQIYLSMFNSSVLFSCEPPFIRREAVGLPLRQQTLQANYQFYPQLFDQISVPGKAWSGSCWRPTPRGIDEIIIIYCLWKIIMYQTAVNKLWLDFVLWTFKRPKDPHYSKKVSSSAMRVLG